MYGYRLAGLVAFVEVVTLQHSRNSVMRCQFYEIGRTHRGHPTRVEIYTGLLGVQNLVNLCLVGRCIRFDLRLRQGGASFVFAARVSDHSGEVADEEDHFVTKLLKLAHLVDQDCVTDVQVRRGRIEARLYDKRSLFFELFRKAVLRKNFVNPAGKFAQLIFDAGH